MKTKIPYLFFIVIYLNQAINSLPGQPIYYLLIEHWKLSMSQFKLIMFFIGIAWYIKPLFGIIIDKGLFKISPRLYLIFSLSFSIIISLFIFIHGLNIYSYIITGILLNFCIAFCDTITDKETVYFEQKHKSHGRIQSIEQIALNSGGIIVALGGAFLSSKLSIQDACRWAFLLSASIPFIMIFYFTFSAPKCVTKIKVSKIQWKWFKNKIFIYNMILLVCFAFVPTFSTALTKQMREVLHVSEMFIGHLGTFSIICSIIGCSVFYKWFSKIELYKVLRFYFIFSAVTNFFYLYLPNKYLLFIYVVLFGIIENACWIGILAMFTKLTPKNNGGFFYPFVASIFNGCVAISSIIAGVIYDIKGYSGNIIACSIMLIICVFILEFVHRKKYI